MSDSEREYPVVIVGSGIAGMTAAIYSARSGNDPIVLRGDEPGGQLTLTTDVANYPGFKDGISGPELVHEMEEQAAQFGTTFEHGIVESVTKNDDGSFTTHLAAGDPIQSDAVIAASGAQARTLDIPGEDELMGYGVSTCATCDGHFFRDEEMVVVGGGDAACEEACFLTKFASKVHLIHRRDEFRAEQIWEDQLREKVDEGEIELHLNSEVVEVNGSKEDGIESVAYLSHPDGHPTEKRSDEQTSEHNLDVGAVFVAIGHVPSTSFLEDLGVSRDVDGYVQIEGGLDGNRTQTDVAGVFAAGDVVDSHYQQAVTAAGMGCQAALDADHYLSD